MAIHHLNQEATSRGARMLRTALGPAIALWLEDASVVEVMLNPDGRLWIDRLSRQMQRLERDVGLTAETLALFVRFWLTITPPLPNDAQAAAQIKGRERFEGFIETLGRRLQKGQNFLREIPEDLVNEKPDDRS